MPVPLLASTDILIVDDTINNVRLLSEMLSQAGFSVRKAINGQMALMAVRSSIPDLILLDINMPSMNGYEVCDQLKQDPDTRHIPIIFLSALDRTADQVKAFELGGSDYITKPFHAEEVITRIQHQLTLSQLKSELEDKNQTLEATLMQLKATQSELIQKQKMLGLSQLIAGIAHEINNPVSFIAGNLEPAQDYFSRLLMVIELYRARYPQPDEDIAAAIAAADLDFIISDFPQLLQSMATGTRRICDIVKALQTFSHQGESPIKAIDLHATLDSILLLLQPRLRGQGSRPSIEVRCDYGSLPLVTCDGKLIGQAMLNLLENAIEAIDGLWEGNQPTLDPMHAPRQEPMITITTTAIAANRIAITIRDNGIGIAEEIKPRIYEPFFSTKPIGQGNGLGLSTSYQIVVSKHGGSLSFTSSPPVGSEFVIQLPTQMPES